MHTAEDALRFMRHEEFWPAFPYLPLSKLVVGAGVLVAFGGPKVYVANLFQLVANNDNLSMHESFKYDSFEALLADGWEVD